MGNRECPRASEQRTHILVSVSDRGDTVARAVAVAAVAVELGAVVVYLVWGLVAERPILDLLRPVPTAVIYSMPALLAALGLRNRQPLLLAAAIAALVLAVFPFSVHSFVLGPAGIVYAVAYAGLAAGRHDRRSVIAVLACPSLLVGALLVLVVADHPACYTKLGSDEVVIDRDPGEAASGVEVIDPESDVVESGCTSDVVVPWEAAASLALSGAAVVTGLRFVPPSRGGSRGQRVRASSQE
jgi:hypothetical protein